MRQAERDRTKRDRPNAIERDLSRKDREHDGTRRCQNDSETNESPEIVLLQPARTQSPATGHEEAVEQPAKVMRIGSMVKQLLDEVRAAPFDEQSRIRLRGDLRAFGPRACRFAQP